MEEHGLRLQEVNSPITPSPIHDVPLRRIWAIHDIVRSKLSAPLPSGQVVSLQRWELTGFKMELFQVTASPDAQDTLHKALETYCDVNKVVHSFGALVQPQRARSGRERGIRSDR
jgi:hypothetical protein